MYIVEGNIGVGKSTFLKVVQEQDRTIDIVLEPVDNWAQQRYGQSLLESFYNTPERWAFTLETLAMICRARDHLREQTHHNPRRMVERSIYSGHYVFAHNDREQGYLNDAEWYVYMQWVQFLLEKECNPPRGFIYLQASPETCFERAIQRNRSSESGLTLDYMRHIHDRHERFLLNKEGVFKDIATVPVLTLNCEEEFVNNPRQMARHLEMLNDFFQSTGGGAGTGSPIVEVAQSLR
jgi:deoxyadenosine/deoxycytidine kinase